MAGGRQTTHVNPGFVGLIAAVIMFALLFYAFTNVALFNKNMTIKAHVASADTLVAGADVEVGGVKVGGVNAVDKDDQGGALVTMTVNTQQTKLYKDASVWIRPHGVFGPKYAAIDPGTSSAGAFHTGDTVALDHTFESVDFEQVLNELDTDTRTSLRTLLYELGSANENRGADEGQIIDQLAVVEQHLTPVLQTIDARSFETGRFIESSAVVNETFAASPLDQIVKENADVLAQLDLHRADVSGFVVHGDHVLSALDTITGGNNVQALRQTLPQLPALLDTLIHFSNGLGQATNELAPALTPKYGQKLSDIGLAIQRTRDSFGECDISDPSKSPNPSQPVDTEHSTQVKIVPCFDKNGKPYVDPGTGLVAHHHVKVLFALHTDTAVTNGNGPTDEEGDTLCGPDTGNATRGGTAGAFTCRTDPVESQALTPATNGGAAPPPYFTVDATGAGAASAFAQPTRLTLLDLLLGN